MKQLFILICFIQLLCVVNSNFITAELKKAAVTLKNDVEGVVNRVEKVSAKVVHVAESTAKTLTDIKGLLHKTKIVVEEIDKRIENNDPTGALKAIHKEVNHIVTTIEKHVPIFETVGNCASIPIEWIGAIKRVAKNTGKVIEELEEFMKAIENSIVKTVHAFLDIIESHPWTLIVSSPEHFAKQVHNIENMIANSVSSVVTKIINEITEDIDDMKKDEDVRVAFKNLEGIVNDVVNFIDQIVDAPVDDLRDLRAGVTKLIKDAFAAAKDTGLALYEDLKKSTFSFTDLFTDMVGAELKNKDGIVRKIGGMCKAIGLLPDTVINIADCVINSAGSLITKSFRLMTNLKDNLTILRDEFSKCNTKGQDNSCIRVSLKVLRDTLVKETDEVLKYTRLVANTEKIRNKCQENAINKFLGETVGKPDNECKKK